MGLKSPGNPLNRGLARPTEPFECWIGKVCSYSWCLTLCPVPSFCSTHYYLCFPPPVLYTPTAVVRHLALSGPLVTFHRAQREPPWGGSLLGLGWRRCCPYYSVLTNHCWRSVPVLPVLLLSNSNILFFGGIWNHQTSELEQNDTHVQYSSHSSNRSQSQPRFFLCCLSVTTHGRI